MSALKSIVCCKLNSQAVSLQQALYALKVRGLLEGLLQPAIEDAVIEKKAAELGLSVTNEELQKNADAFRVALQLNKVQDTLAWLSENHLAVEDLERRLETQLLCDKVKEQVTKGKVEGYFAEKRFQFDQAVLSQIVVDSEAVARELLTQLQEGEVEWNDVVAKRSKDEASKKNHGTVGLQPRAVLSPSVQAAVFNAKPGDIVGPLKTDMGYHLIRVDELRLGQLDAETTEAIQDDLFDQWLSEERQRAKTEYAIFELV